jgi:hypothetical protein
MSNDSYVVSQGNFNSFSGSKSGSGYKLSDTGGQIAPGLYSGANFKVRAGFQYIKSIIPFSFRISGASPILVNFGILDPNSPSLRTQNLIVSNGSAAGYNVYAFANHQLLNPANGQLIPDTVCDSGPCSETVSAPWTSTLTYGFGYRCDNVSGTDCASGFTTGTYFKQFADASFNESPVAVMTGLNVGRDKEVTITYKANISAVQPAGLYSNVITYIATPTY